MVNNNFEFSNTAALKPSSQIAHLDNLWKACNSFYNLNLERLTWIYEIIKPIIKSKVTALNYKIELVIDSELNSGMQQYRPSLINDNASVQDSPKELRTTDMELRNLKEGELNQRSIT
jgi:hypothetical protein